MAGLWVSTDRVFFPPLNFGENSFKKLKKIVNFWRAGMGIRIINPPWAAATAGRGSAARAPEDHKLWAGDFWGIF